MSIFTTYRLWLLFSVALLIGFAPAGYAAVGRTLGTFAVSPAGAATYTIPIFAPRGPNGLQPNVALVYNSRQGNGYVGVGWGVSGLSSIYRCNLTSAQDVAPASIALATSDGYCLDGQRLRLTSGTYGVSGSVYQTEIANFKQVTANGTAGNGPAYWVVKDRNGVTYTYGNGGNSQVLASGSTTALSWQLNQVADTSGNTMTISYSTATGTAVPSVLSWVPTSHGASSYAYTMTFHYGTNVAPPQGYVGGTAVTNPNLLGSITVSNNATFVKSYTLTYQQAPVTSYDRLIQVKECADGAGTNCLSPTSISYQDGATGIGSAISLGTTQNVPIAGYDFNGDGIGDLIWQNGTYFAAFGSPTGFGTALNTTAADGSVGVVFGNVDGTDRDGILAPVSGIWWYYKWNGTAFVGASTGVAVEAAVQPLLTDLNGDGRPDLVQVGSDNNIRVRLNTSQGGSVSFSSTEIVTGADAYTFIYSSAGGTPHLHFWGDAQDDLLAITKSCTGCEIASHTKSAVSPQTLGWTTTYTALHFTGTGFVATTLYSTTSGIEASAPSPVDYADYNDDGCTDILTWSYLLLSACNGAPPVALTFPSGTQLPLGGMDWNGDGRRDVLVSQSNGYMGVVLSTGSGLSNTIINTSIPSNLAYTVSHNATGDGLDALVTTSGTPATSQYYLHNGAGTAPDLLTSITDGYGNSASPTYVSIAQNNYTKSTDAVYPYKNYVGPLYVVNQTTFSDPSNPGGTYQQTFSYTGAWLNLQGRGLTPFASIQTEDLRNAIWDTKTFDRTFPYTGMLTGEITSQNSGNTLPITNVSYTPVSVTLDNTTGNQRYFTYLSASTTKSYEVGGSKNGQLTSTKSMSYIFDNYGNVKTITSTLKDNDATAPASPYLNDTWTTTVTNTPDVDTAHWCLTLLTQSQVAYSATIGSAVTRTLNLTPDTTNCRYTQIVTEPSSTTYKVTEALGYDSFGNVNSDSVTGVGMTARSTSINWGTTGQFPMSKTDSSGATTTLGYNFSYGLPSSMTDANGATTAWQYSDGFGRLTQETRSDNTYTVLQYNDCANWGGCLLGNHTLALAHYQYNTDGTVETDGTTYFDELERPIILNKRLLTASSYDRTDLRYDNLGRLHQKSYPCTFSSVTTPCSNWTTTAYDVTGRVTGIQRPVSATNSTLQGISYQYQGRTLIVTDPQTFTTTSVADVNGWRRQTQDAYNYTVTFGYDAAGSQTSVTDSASNTLWSGTYAYGTAAFLTSEKDMDRGAWTYTNDALGDRTGWKDPKSQSFSATYDSLSRPLTRKEPDLFTQWTWGSTPANHNVGQLQSVCTGGGSNPTACSSSGYAESEAYDSLGRPSQRAITIPSVGTFTYGYAYNATTGHLDTLTYPVSTSSKSLTLKYAYQNGYLESITDTLDSPNVTVWQANAMNPAGQLTQETLGNGLVTTRNYDAVTQWLGSVQAGVGGGAAIQNLSILYDLVGNVTQRQDNNHALTENIYYDDVYRLTSSTLSGTQNLLIKYDLNGNITSRSDVASGATWTYDTTRKHAVTKAGSSSFTYAYDANGNMSTRQGQTFSWYSYNYPSWIRAGSGSTAESVNLHYGPDRQRWQQNYTGNGTTETTSYVGPMEVVTSGSVTDYRHYIYAGNSPVAVYSRKSTGTNTFSYLLSEHLGSVATITNASGASVVAESFTPFGVRRNPTTWSGAASNTDLTTSAGITRQGFTFQTSPGLWMGLNHMNGRVEDAVTGRFVSPDPIGTSQDNTQSWNRYSYVTNNPLTLKDPTGFDQCITLDIPGGDGFVDDFPDDGGLPLVGVGTPGFSQEICLPDFPPATPGVPIGNPPPAGGQTVAPSRGPQIRPPAPPTTTSPPATTPPTTTPPSNQPICPSQYVCKQPQDPSQDPPQDPRCHQPLPGPTGPGGGTVSGNTQYIGIASASGVLTGAPNTSSIAFLIWLNNVRPGGIWDYKLTGAPGSEAAGNFNFGATGSVFFNNPVTLLSGAGVVQVLTNPLNSSGGFPGWIPPYWDEQGDQVDITAGINAGC